MSMTVPLTDNIIAAADKVREDTDDAYNRVRAMTELNTDAIRKRLAQIYVAAKTTMADLQESAGASYERQFQQAQTAAFGIDDLASTPGDKAQLSMSYREALDRTEAIIDPDEGARLLKRSQETGDELLARAIGKRAWDMGGRLGGGSWGGVLNDFTSTRPKAADAIATLTSLHVAPNARSMFAFILPIPPELGNLPGYSIASLAAS